MKAYVAAGILVAAVLITAWQTYYVATLVASGNVCGCAIPVPLYIPLFFALGVVAGIALLKIISASGPCRGISVGSARVSPDSIAKLFNREEEWYIVREILEKGSILQSDVSKRFGKVRSSRAVAALESRDVVSRERVGRTYVLLAGPALRALVSGEQQDEHGSQKKS